MSLRKLYENIFNGIYALDNPQIFDHWQHLMKYLFLWLRESALKFCQPEGVLVTPFFKWLFKVV